MKSVVLVVASLLALGSALPLPEEEVQGKPTGFTEEQLQLLYNANPEDNDIDLSEPEPNPLPLNLNQKVEEEVVAVPSEDEEPVALEEQPVPAKDNAEETQSQVAPEEKPESEKPTAIEEPVATEEDTKEAPTIPVNPIASEVPSSQEEKLSPPDAREEPVIIEDPVAPLQPVVNEEPQIPDDEIFKRPDIYRIPFSPEDPSYDSYSTVEQEPIIEVFPVDEVEKFGVMDGDEEDFSDEETFENDEADQDGVVIGSTIIENSPEPVVVGYANEEYSQEPTVNEDDISEEEVIEEVPQVFLVPENEEEMVDDVELPMEVMINPENQPEAELQISEYPIPVDGPVFVEDDQEEPEEDSEGVYFLPSGGSEGFETDERVFEIGENPGSAFFIPDNEPQEVIDSSPMVGDSSVFPVQEDENSEVFVVEGEDAEGDRFAVAVEEDENGEIQREVLIAEMADEDSSEEIEDDLPMQVPLENGYEEGFVDGAPILAIENESGEVQSEVLVEEMPTEPLLGEPINDNIPLREVFVVEKEGPNEEVIALAVEDENGDIHGEIIDAEVGVEGFPSEPLPGEETLPEHIFVPEEDSSEEVVDLEVDVDENGDVHVIEVPEVENEFSEDIDGPSVGFIDLMDDEIDEETDEEPHSVMLGENDEEDVFPIAVTPEDVDGEEPFVMMSFNDDIVPVIAPAEENYPEDELKPLPPVVGYSFPQEMPMEPEEEIPWIPEEKVFGMEVIPDEIHPEEIDDEVADDEDTFEYDPAIMVPGIISDPQGEDDDTLEIEDQEDVFESDPALVVPGIIPDPQEEPEIPEIFLGPEEIIEIIPYEDPLEGNRPIIFPEGDSPSHNLPVFPYQFATRVASLANSNQYVEDEGYDSAEEKDEGQQPMITSPLFKEAEEPQSLQIPDKTLSNLFPIAGVPSQGVQQQQQQQRVPIFPHNPNQYQRYSPSFTGDQFQITRDAPNPMSSSYAPQPFKSQYVPLFPNFSTYLEASSRQPYDTPMPYDRYTQGVYYDGHAYDDGVFYDDPMHVPIYYEQPSRYYNTRQRQNPFYNYKGYATPARSSFSAYRPYPFNYFRPTEY